jgi:hypothetical protein
MRADAWTGRAIGALLLVQIAVGLWINFGLLDPVFEAPGFLYNAAAHADRMGAAALLGVLGSGLSLLLLALFWPYARAASPVLARVYAAVLVAGFVMSAIEQAASLSMLSLSQAFAQHGAGKEALFEGLRGVVAEQRNWVHYIDKLMSGAALLMMHVLLLRGRLLPALLPIAGLGACALQLSALLHPFFGAEVPLTWLAPLALVQLLLALWLIARGFRNAGFRSIAAERERSLAATEVP